LCLTPPGPADLGDHAGFFGYLVNASRAPPDNQVELLWDWRPSIKGIGEQELGTNGAQAVFAAAGAGIRDSSATIEIWPAAPRRSR